MKAETPIAAASSPGAVALAAGFAVGVAKAGIKPGSDRLDVALLVCDGPAVAAGVFTQNQVRAEPVRFCESNLARRKPVRAVLVNSGNANACTGAAGKVTVRDSATAVARALGCSASEVLLASTGVIGVPLPTERLVAGVSAAAAALATGADAGHAGARAIMTTDSRAKEYAVRLSVGGKTVTVGGMAKGAGMIHPNMATMLAFVTTDAVLSQSQAQRLLADVVEDTFNSITVDGDTSTNDTLLLLASGKSGARLAKGSAAEKQFAAALRAVCAALAEDIAGDGEGAEKLLVVDVRGGRSDEEARLIARTVASSPLVKTAVHGADPNWGRVLAAAGRAGPKLDPNKLSLTIGGALVCKAGGAHPPGEAEAQAHMRGRRVAMELRVGSGKGRAVAYGCDLTKAYVDENASYRT